MRQSLSKRNIWKSVLSLLLLITLLTNGVVRVHHHAYAAGVSPQAISVYGQAGSFTTATTGISSTTLNMPRGAVEDSSGNLYVSDYNNSRVLYYPAGSTTATRVYGQGGSFTTGTVNTGGITANSLNGPVGLTLDNSGNLYVSDVNNNRVLYYAAGSTTATRVYGQGGNFTTNTVNNGGITANSLNVPSGVALDSSNNLYITDYLNNRVLYYAAGSTTATRVYGQGGNFTTNTANNGGITANSLNQPVSVALDSSGNLYITDTYNNRVVYFAGVSTTATRVYGQGGSFTTNTANNGGITANSLSLPSAIALDSSGNLYVTEYLNNRVLYYPAGNTTATRVYGQGGSFTVNTANNGGISATSINLAYGINVDSSGNIFVADSGNNRLLKYQTALSVTTQPAASTAEQTTISTNASLIDVGSSAVFTDFTGTVTAAIKAGTGGTGATLGGTTSVASVSGVASFNNLTINVAGTSYILTLSYPGVGSANTNAFAITLSPAGFWKFDEGSGTTTADSSGNSNTGTITGASWTNGKINTALSFNGTSNYVSMGTAPAALQMGTGSFTVMSWFKTTATGGSQRLVSMGDASWANGYQLSIGPNASTCTGCVGGSVGAGGTQANSLSFYSTSSFNDGLWHHSAMVINQTAHTAQIYVDGVAQAVSTQAGTCGTAGGTSVNITACSSLSATGANAFTTGSSNGTSEYFTGSLDNVRIYASAVIGQDIQNFYTAASAGPQAITVYGQAGSFITASSGTTANTLNSPRAIAFDSSGNSYIADYTNNRVLYYPSGSTTATRVYGQNGSFTTALVNNTSGTANTVSATSLYQPFDVTLDSSGNLYVADGSNSRVLYYAAGSTTATRVYGQGGSFTTATINNGGVTANSLNNANNIALDSSGNLYIADSANNRVLYYAAGSTTATRVYGQGSNFTTNSANNGGVSATSLSNPNALVLDSSGNLYVTDSANNRVLYYAAGSMTATRVYGQNGSFTTALLNNTSGTANTVSATSLSGPRGVTVDNSGNVYIADFGNNRMLYYPSGSTTATRVYGQNGSFTTALVNNTSGTANTVSATSLNAPLRTTIDSSGNIYIIDMGNNRVLQFQTGLGMTAQPPASTPTLSPFSTSVALVDIGSNTVFTDFTGTVTAAIKSGTGTAGATLGGTTSLAATSGVATFSTLTINSSGTGYQLTFTSTGVTLVNSYAFTISVPTLGGFWKFDEGSGTTTADSSGNNNTGTITGANWINGRINTGLSFNGTSNYVSMGTAPAALQMGTAGSFTVMSWFKSTVVGGSQRMVSMGDASWANGYQLSLGPNASACTGCVGGSVGAAGTKANSLSFSSTSAFNDGNWHHAAMVIDQNANTAQLYVDGVAQAVSVQAGTCGTAAGTSVNIAACNSLSATGANAFSVGSSNGTAEYFTGNLDSVRVYSGALGGADILSIYTSVPVGPQAFTVYGQSGNFTASSSGTTTTTLKNPRNTAEDSSGNLYVTDYNNNRVLYYPAGSLTATRVYGQGGSFTTGTVNTGGVSANSLNGPTGIILDGGGNLYVGDANNNRVLFFPVGSTTATVVYGQGGSFTTNTANNGGVSATSFNQPNSLALDSSGNLYVTDYLNNRVLYFPAGSTTATQVYGQGGSFTTNTTNKGGISATSLYVPLDIDLDSSNNLYVGDSGNNRVLYYASGSTTATRVYGQGGSYTTGTVNNGGISATSLNNPLGVDVDSGNNLYVGDTNNNRVLYYPSGSTTATRVYGQAGSFTTNTANNGGTSATSLNQPFGVNVDSSGNIFVADSGNSRLLQFQTALSITTQPAASTPVQSALSTTARMIDVGSNTVFSDFTGTVTAAIKAGTGTTGATLSGTTSLAAVSGVASFTTLKINTSGIGYILTLSYPGVGSGNTNAFTMSLTPAGFWKFDEGSGTTTADSSGNANTGTLTNSPTWTTGRINSALNFNGTNSYVTMGTAPAALQMGTGSFTVMSWFKTTATGGSQRMVSMGDASWANGYQLSVGPNGSTCTGCVGGSIGAAGTKANSLSFSSTSSFNDGNWHHAAMVIDQTADIAQIYIDGVAQAVSVQAGTCGTASGTSVNFAACTSLSETGANAFTVGSSNGTAEYFTGTLDSVRVYASALSSIDVQSIYASASIGPQAIVVYGQGGNFSTGSANNGGTTASSFNKTRSAIFDSSGNIYAIDYNNSRVLYFPVGTTTATRVYGQAGSFTTGVLNNPSGTPTADNLSKPTGLALDSSGNLYIADTGNNRVLYYAAGSTTATRVYGQAGSFTTNTINNGGISATSLNNPNALAVDSGGNLYVADYTNNRVLYYTAGSTTATAVYGQGGSFTTGTINNGGISATSLYQPVGLNVDSTGNLYVSDTLNNRVLYFSTGSTTATRVYGQNGSFTTGTPNNGGISANSFNTPNGLALSSSDNLYVVDENNNRMLYFPTGSTTATRVYGQAGNFTTGISNNGGISATSFNQPFNVSLDANGNLYVADYSNSRVLQFQTVLSVTSQPVATTPAQPALSASAVLMDLGSGATFNDSTSTVLIAIKAGTGTVGATLSGTTSVATINGVASFSNLSINKAGAGYILTLSSSGVGSANTNAFTINASTLAGYWPLDENTGTTTADASGNNDTGTITGASWTPGRINSGLSFNGTSNYVSMGTPAALQMGTGSFTVLSWFKTSAITGSQEMVSMGDASSANGYQLSVGPNGSTCTGCVGGGIGAGGTQANALSFSSTNAFNDGKWHQTAMVIDQTAHTAQIYVDGIAQAVSTQTGTCGTASGTSVTITACSSLNATGTTPFDLGSYNGASSFFNGTLDEVRVYNSALSSANIQSLYYAASIGPQAVTVYGQGGSFTTNGANYGGGANGLHTPRNSVLDSSGNLYIADYLNHRVLYYAVGSTTGTRVYGQGGIFTTGSANNGGISANSLNGPTSVALDSIGDLYVADALNNRVLYYAAGSTTATVVYGQAGSFTTNTANNGGISATSLNSPTGVALDSSGNLYVVDSGNSRVLYYAAGSTTATRVYGQAGSFTTGTVNNGGISATSLSSPMSLALDSSNNLYVADSSNNRILYYPSGNTTATGVYGQNGNFTTSTANNGGISSLGLSSPYGVTVDSIGNLYATDYGNNRALYYPAGSTNAIRVYGQNGNFTTNTANNGGVSNLSLSGPYGVTVDSSGNIYIADYNNNRLLKFQTSLSVTGQPAASTMIRSSLSITTALTDAGSGEVFPDFTSAVSAAIKAGTGTTGAVLSGTTPVAAVSGTASFTTLSIDTSGIGYMLTFSSPGVGSGNTNTFTIGLPLAGLWPLDEDTGTIAYDSSINGDNGTITGASWTAGKINSGLGFNGTSNTVSMGTPTPLQFGTGNFTVSSWFKTSVTTGSQELVSMGDASSANGYQLSVGTNGIACTGCVGGGVGAGGTQANALSFSTTSAFNDGTWHLATMVINQASGTAQMYVDGTAQALTTQAGTCGTASGIVVNISACTSLNATGSSAFSLGSYNGASSFFTGSLDVPRLYSNALSATDVQTLYTNDVNTLSEYAANASFTTTVGTNATYTLPIAVTYQFTPAPGWSLSITTTTLTSGANTLPTTASKITSVANTCTSTCTPTTMTNTISGFPMTIPAGTTAPTAVKFFSTASGSGTGAYTVTPTIAVTVPYVAKTGAYTSTVTLTAATGP